MPFPQTLDARPKVIFFTDFDGTITLQDTNDYITDNYGMGGDKRHAIMEEILVDKSHLPCWLPRHARHLENALFSDPADLEREHQIRPWLQRLS